MKFNLKVLFKTQLKGKAIVSKKIFEVQAYKSFSKSSHEKYIFMKKQRMVSENFPPK